MMQIEQFRGQLFLTYENDEEYKEEFELLDDVTDKLPQKDDQDAAHTLITHLRSRALTSVDDADDHVLIPIEPIELSLLIEFLLCIILYEDLNHKSLQIGNNAIDLLREIKSMTEQDPSENAKD